MAAKRAARAPKSPIDDIAKWIASQGGKKLSKSEILKMKRFARGIGYTKEFDKVGEAALAKKVAKGKTSPRVAQHIENMAMKRQDKEARVFGDYTTPHAYFGVGEMLKSGATRQQKKVLGSKFKASWDEEVAIARANARKAAAAAKPKRYAASKPTKKQAAARKAASAKLSAAAKAKKQAAKESKRTKGKK